MLQHQRSGKWVPKMRNYKQYNRYPKQSKAWAVAILLALVILAVMIVLDCCGMFDEPMWQPDTYYPLVNSNVSWEQTWAFGGVM